VCGGFLWRIKESIEIKGAIKNNPIPRGRAEPAEVGVFAPGSIRAQTLNSVWNKFETMSPKKTSRETNARSIYGKRNERTPCSIRCYGDNTEMIVDVGDVSEAESENEAELKKKL
jgi:hypothetical protein